MELGQANRLRVRPCSHVVASMVLHLLIDLFHNAGVVTMLLLDMVLKIPYWCQSPHKWCTEEPKSTHKNKLPPFPSTKHIQHFSSICSLDANTWKCVQNFTCGVIQNQSVYYSMRTWSSTHRASSIPLRGIRKSSMDYVWGHNFGWKCKMEQEVGFKRKILETILFYLLPCVGYQRTTRRGKNKCHN